MTVVSGMTGFARVSGEAAFGTWAWEIKSVNGKGLDVRVHTPPGFDALERLIKTSAATRFWRGSLQAGLRIEFAEPAGAIDVNEAALGALVAAFVRVYGSEPSAEALATLMTTKGVVETGRQAGRDLADEPAVLDLLAGGGELALNELLQARRNEGAALLGILGQLLDEMTALTDVAQASASTQPQLLKVRLEKQLAELQADRAIDTERLAAEVAISAAKADVREETDRLTSHFETGRRLLSSGGAIGRKLDFLAQELNREANTLCSKSVSLDLTNAGLGLKALIDQFKEQAANVE